jgi:uncharacterized protein (TIGR02996 family)
MRWTELDARLDAGDFEAALEAALTLWRETRHPAIADLVDAISTRSVPTPIDARRYHAAWLDLARRARPRDVGALIAGLRQSLPRPMRIHRDLDAVVPGGWMERIAALGGVADDPRLAAAIVRVMRDAPWRVYEDLHAPAYGAPLDLVARIADVRVVPELEALLAAARERRVRSMWYLFVAIVPEVIAKIQARERSELSAEDAGHCAALVERYATRTWQTPAAKADHLLALIHDHPDDDDPREVYADALLEAGDPRGELMSLQLRAERGDTTADSIRRARSLLRANSETWLGDLAFVLKSVVFERGMIAEAELVQNAAAEPAVWERAVHSPELATVHTLRKGRGNEPHYSSFVFSPAMRGLREVTMLSRSMIERACRASEPWPFTHLVLEKPLTPKLMAELAATEALPALERLTLTFNADQVEDTVRLLEPFARSRELAEITLIWPPWDRPHALLAGWFGSAARLAPVTLGLANHTYRLRAVPGASGLVVDVEVKAPYGIAEMLFAMPAIERLVLRPHGRPGTRVTLGAEQELVTDPYFRTMLAELAPLHPEVPPDWPT